MKRIIAAFMFSLLCISLTACRITMPAFRDERHTSNADIVRSDSAAENNEDNSLIESTSGEKTIEDDETNAKAPLDGSTFEVFFLDVGQGDAAVIMCDGKAMLIDGGDSKKSSLIYSFLKSHNIDHLDYIVASHPDADHIGGLSGALNYATVSKAFCTTNYHDTKTFQSFVKYLKQQGVDITVPSAGDTYALGSASFTILAPQAGLAVSDNTSLIIRVVYGDTSFLFTGDAEVEDENNAISAGNNLKSTVLKVAHHGSESSTSWRFLDEVDPDFAVISVGGDNNYGHPTEAVLSRLHDNGVKTFRTDIQGDIHCTSDGSTVSFDCEKNADADVFSIVGGYASWVASQRTTEQENSTKEEKDIDSSAPSVHEYVANTNTGKFHYPNCTSVGKMKEKNKAFISGTHDELISMGYSPCGNCHP